MSLCAAKNPERPDLICILNRTERSHPEHLAMRYVEGRSQPEQIRWPNPEYRSPAEQQEQARKAKTTVEINAAKVRAQQPPTKLKVDQRKKTRLGQVANMLVNNVGVWIDGHRLETVEIGGSSGLRRLRELRDEYGWKIIQRPTATSTDQYQLVELPDEFKDPPS